MVFRNELGIGVYLTLGDLRFVVVCGLELRPDTNDLDLGLGLEHRRNTGDVDHRMLTEIRSLYFYCYDGQRDVQARKAAIELPSLLLFRLFPPPRHMNPKKSLNSF